MLYARGITDRLFLHFMNSLFGLEVYFLTREKCKECACHNVKLHWPRQRNARNNLSILSKGSNNNS